MKKGFIYIGITTFLFSTMEIALKTISDNFNPVQLNFSRFLVGGIILLPFALKALKSKNISLTSKDIKTFALLGLTCVVISMTFYQLAVMNTKASVVAVLFSCNPIFVMIFAYIVLKEKIHKNNIIALVLELIGIILIINPINTKLSITGITLTLLAAITFAIYGVLGKKSCAKFGGIVVTCFSFILGGLEMLILSLLSHLNIISNALITVNLNQFADIPILSGYTTYSLPTVLYIFICVTGIGYALYFKAMEVTSANTTSLVFFFKPILSPILALILLKELIPINMILGIICILSGSLASLLPSFIAEHHKKLSIS